MNTSTKHPLHPAADLAARILLAFIFVIAGYGKITGYADTQGYMEAFGVPGMLLPLVIAAELGLGILLVIGYRVRLAAAGLAAFSLVSGLIFHLDLGDPNQQIHLMKNLAITGGLIILALNGAGAWSLDARRRS
jgi:putative oxidoreductase